MRRRVQVRLPSFRSNSAPVIAGAVAPGVVTGTKTIQLLGGAGNIQEGAIWTIRDGGVNPLASHTVTNASQESLASIAHALAVSLGGTATAVGAIITLTHSGAVNAWVEKAASASSIIRAVDETSYASVTSVTGLSSGGIHVGYDNVENMTVKLGDHADQVHVLDTLGNGAGRVLIRAAGGADTITVSNATSNLHGVIAELQVEGGNDADALNAIDTGANPDHFTNGRFDKQPTLRSRDALFGYLL